MKWKLTGRFLFSVVLIVILVIIINIVTFLTLYIVQGAFHIPVFKGEKVESAESFTRDFQKYITFSNNKPIISDKGKRELIDRKAWIQILDENGKELYGYRLPKAIKKKYTPLEIVNTYKYVEADIYATVYFSGKELNHHNTSYLIGFESPNIKKITWSYDSRDLMNNIKIGSILLLLIDGLIALLIGYFFSKRLTKPLYTLINGIQRLANKDYNLNYEPEGVYKDVFYNVNNLSYQLKAIDKERIKLDKMKEEWIGNISHDIKTPLASIQGYAEMMKDKGYDFSIEEMREYAEIIERKSHYLKDVVEDLNLSIRLKNEKLSLNKTKTNLVALLRSIVIDILNDAKYSTRHIDFQYTEEKIEMEVDELLIRRAINNLIYNAIVHNDENIQIIVSIEKKERVQIIIKDNGIGIKSKELDYIFDRYYRGTNTGESHKGSGLGMAIANDIIRTHNGVITIDSMVDCGTSIEIQL
ncbi:sensor histidine kinase [Rummeliibacillus sp. NPDC094406]|uniref:sensor histidine kinase n=1 Tax=Rummeliibacillus sp. NPDC094406 TaxID=3364511 RepID=UPI003815B8A2